MFSHLATFRGGAKDGQRSTIVSEDQQPPRVLFVCTDLEPHLKFVRARYERNADGIYEYAGVSR